MRDEKLLQRRHRLLGAEAPLFYNRPLHLVRGQGVWVWDVKGARYLDAYNNVPHVGHCHPRVVEALSNQAKILSTSTRYLDERIVEYGERLTETFDADLGRLALCCSGTEATELALRIARSSTGNEGIIVTDFCYHGNSSSVAALSTAFPNSEKFDARIRTISVPGLSPSRHGVATRSVKDSDVACVTRAILSLEKSGMKPAAILFDTVFATEGIPRLPLGYVDRVVSLVKGAGGLYIADEVQPGFGRTGSGMWGYQLFGEIPDLVTLGKPMGNGYPLAGVVGRSRVFDAFWKSTMYFNTFGGNPVACAVGEAVLEVIEDEGLIESARLVGRHLLGGLDFLKTKHPIIADTRGYGLFIAVELVSEKDGQQLAAAETNSIVNGMRERGVLIGQTGRYGNVLKIRPPMSFELAHADKLLVALGETLAGR